VKRRRHLQRPGYLLIMVTILLASACLAEDAARVPAHGGHRFLPLVDVPGPFTQTFVRNSVGLGTALAWETSPVVIDGVTVDGLRGNLLAALLEFEYQQQVKSWLAARARFKIAGRLGTEVQTLLAQGITASTTFELGWLFHLYRSEKTLLAGTFEVSNGSFTGINLTGFIEDFINGRETSLVSKTPVIRSGPGLNFAWAASDLVGVTLNGRTGYGESSDRESDSEWFWSGGAAIDFDLKTRTRLPFGLGVGYRFDSFPEGGAQAESYHEALLRLAYTTPGDFLISLDMTWGSLPLKGIDQNVRFGSTSINLRYYF
jgi:hypothetical protein